MRMEPEEIRKLMKKTAIIASFFLLALLFYLLGGRDGKPVWRTLLLLYALGVTVIMVLAILVQSGSGGGLAGLGGAGGESLLGARSATPIAKATYVMGALLLFICMLLARMGHATTAEQLTMLRDARERAVVMECEAREETVETIGPERGGV